MSVRPNSFKHYPHIFSPMQMIYNYTNNIKSSICDFFRQYLRPEGREVLLLFNRYMLIGIFLNFDIRLFFALCILVYIVIKLVKIKPWVKERHANVPLSYVNTLYELRKKEDAMIARKKREQDEQESDPSFLSQKTSLINEKCRMPILCVQEKQQMLKKTNNSPQQIGYFTVSHIEQYIYNLINNLISSYCRVVWYMKWKSIAILWVITGLVYVFEPSNEYDRFKITTKKDGALQIGEVQKASQIINYFHLIFICILTNIILFYYYGTRKLKNQLLLQIYTREYTYNLIKNRRIRTINSSVNAEGRFAYGSRKPMSEEPGSPVLFSTIVDKGRHVDLEELKNFASNSQQKSSPKVQVPQGFSQRKFSHDVPIIPIETPPKKPIKNSPNLQIEQLLQRSRVQSEQEVEQESSEEKEKPEIILPDFSQNSNNNKLLTSDETSVQFDPIGSLITQNDVTRGPVLQKKNIFLSGSSSQKNLLVSRNRKSSDQIKNHQVYQDFRISLFKVQQSKRQTYKNK